MMFSSVVLPDPDRPQTATSWPRLTVNDTSRRACTAVCPLPKVRDTPRAATISLDRLTLPAAPAGHEPVSRSGQTPMWPGSCCSRTRSLHAERLGHLARQLDPAGPVQHRVLDRVPGGVAVLVGAVVAERLAAGPAVPDRDRAPDLGRHRRVVGHHEHGHAQLGVGRLQRREHLPRGGAVQLAGRLVGEQHPRAVGQRGGDRGALLLAAGHLGRLAPGAVRHAQHVQQLAGRAGPAAAARTPANRMGMITFCSAVRYGSRLREVCCQRKPTVLRR